MRILLTGGVSAGHINPALAIAETVKQNDPHVEIAFVGIKGGKEEDLIPREGYPLYYVEAKGIRRSLSLSNIKALWLAVTSPYSKKTTRILKEFAPDIVIGTGGYASWPLMAAAARWHIPTAVHESNALPGLAVRQLQGRVDEIWTNFDTTRELLKAKEKVTCVGNPLRLGFGTFTREEARKKLEIPLEQKLILSFGGSLGAEDLNTAVLQMMKEYSSKQKDILHLHASGKRDFQNTMEAAKRQRIDQYQNCIIKEYIYDMPLWMAAADLVICRAGAMTLSELSMMQKAAILVPSPHVADNHQYRNAKALADRGAALLCEESETLGNDLCALSEKVLSNKAFGNSLRENIKEFANKDANRMIWEHILQLTKKK